MCLTIAPWRGRRADEEEAIHIQKYDLGCLAKSVHSQSTNRSKQIQVPLSWEIIPKRPRGISWRLHTFKAPQTQQKRHRLYPEQLLRLLHKWPYRPDNTTSMNSLLCRSHPSFWNLFKQNTFAPYAQLVSKLPHQTFPRGQLRRLSQQGCAIYISKNPRKQQLGRSGASFFLPVSSRDSFMLAK